MARAAPAAGAPRYNPPVLDRSGHAAPSLSYPRSRSLARSRRALGVAEPRRPRRGSSQDRAPRLGRRHAQLGPALPQGQGWQGNARVGVLPFGQPRQEIGDPRYSEARGPAHCARARGEMRRAARELQSRRAREIRPGVRKREGNQSAHHLLPDHRVRPVRPERAPPRLRLHLPRHGRPHEHHRRARQRAGRRAAKGRYRGD